MSNLLFSVLTHLVTEKKLSNNALFKLSLIGWLYLTLQDILKRVTEFRSAKSLSKYDISVVIIMSHGSNKGIRGGYTEITGVDGEGLSTEDIVDQFTIEKCPGMKGKPKIFIFQCCR